jgi:hypothetical protein
LCHVELASVPSYDFQAVMRSSRRENQVLLGIRVTGIPALSNKQPSSQHDLFGNLKHSAVKHRPDSMGQPVFQICPSVRIADEFNSEANLGKSDHADEELIKSATCYERKYRRMRASSSKLGQNVCIEQPAH